METITISKNEVLEGHKLIAKFMGHKRNGKVSQRAFDGSFFNDDFRYSTDWNWLNEVVDKIESLGYQVTIKNISCEIKSWWATNEYDKTLVCGTGRIAATYHSVVEFIKWYNSAN